MRVAFLILILFNIAFFAAAFNITAPALASISHSLEVEATSLGILFLAEFGGFFGALLVGGIVSDRINKKKLLIGGCLLIGLGMIGVFFIRTLLQLCWCMFVFGAGGGLIEGMATALIGKLFAGKEHRGILSFSQVFYGIGAVVGPFMMGKCLDLSISWKWMYLIVGVLNLFIVIFYFIPSLSEPKETGDKNQVTAKSVFTDKLFILLGLGIFLYVSSEMGVASWICLYFQSTLKASVMLASGVLSLFWGGLILGRIICTFLPHRWCSFKIVFYLLCGGLLMQALAMMTQNVVLAMILFGLMGLCFSGIWPTIMAIAQDHFRQHLGKVTSLMVALGGLGALVYPYIMGRIYHLFSLRIALSSTMLIIIANIILFHKARKWARLMEGRGVNPTIYTS